MKNEKLREPKVLKKIAKLKALNVSTKEIRAQIKQDYGIEASEWAINNLMKKFAIRSNIFLESEQDLANALKESILDLLTESKENVRILGDLRNQIREILKLVQTQRILESDDDKKFRQYLGDIKEIIKTMDNSISTEKGVLELLDRQKSNVVFGAVASIQSTKKDLIELERAGMIVINPRYRKQLE